MRIVDRVAYINHDIDDAVRRDHLGGDLPTAEIELLGSTGAKRIDLLVRDMVERSRAEGDIAQSEEVGARCCGCGSSCSSGCIWGRGAVGAGAGAAGVADPF